MHHTKLIILTIAICSMFCTMQATSKKTNQPNVILVLTDDLGIGDLACMGNPWIKTPNVDAFHKQSVRMNDFHVSPLCTPTRAALVTGRYPINNGAWATFKGRDALSQGVVTIADIFQQNGYSTALFGKWHLGDNYPVRPTDCGFQTAVNHHSGGVGELSDYWGNNYFDDVYYVNNEPKQFEGYCTDVWFEQTMNYLDTIGNKPFFVYLPTNAPHDPLYVDPKYAEPYKHLEGKEIVAANLYGMIANFDENFGKLRAYLKKKKLEDNTIFIFMSDNGTRYGYSPDGKLGYNKGFSGIKGDKREGGHRVPFFIYWPNGKVKGGKDIKTLTAHVDVLPTLAAMCNINLPHDMQIDGVDFSSLLTNKDAQMQERSVFVHHRQDWRQPDAIQQSCIMKNNWRLINGKQLYNVESDPAQKKNIAAQHPDVVKDLLSDNSEFISRTVKNKEFYELPVAIVGNKAQREIKLTVQHAVGESSGIWKSEQVAEGVKSLNNTHALQIETDGYYTISCRRWPKECSGAILGTPSQNPKNMFTYKTIAPQKVRIRIANQILEKNIKPADHEVNFNVYLTKGKTLLVTDFVEGKNTYGVYYTYVMINDER